MLYNIISTKQVFAQC